MKYVYIIILLIIAIVISLIALLVYYFGPWLTIIFGALFLSTPPPEPVITYGEFPISIEYEINGETRFVEDTIICEFDGIESYGMNEQQRKWKSTLKSGNKRITLLQVDNDTVIYFLHGSAEYYMDDLGYKTQEEYEVALKTNCLMLQKLEDGKYTRELISLEKAETLYNLKIISYNYAKPITNSFPEK